ncbi:tryptophan--tRNA ligase [Thiolinea disciformis]|uniref:tryptophan--tRNA ligase n=1 Tax=Thiolinea disciformis TaxID=125614 RepID=UPI0003780DC8|nr:tryptophan--tRNA ligase [Thiolinea disciformis]
MENNKSPVILSGIRPTGEIHLGNYFGAIQYFVKLQEQGHQCFYFVADLHALTTAMEDHIDVDKNSVEVVRWYLACGLDSNKSTIYRQSDILEIPFFNLLLGMITPEGELRRCTTYKDKVADMEGKRKMVSLGLLAYPVLMASDILFCNADIVPVGEDQLQHLEIAREIARKYNHHFSKKHKFTEPRSHLVEAVRVPGLKGEGKMSKSVGGPDNVIYLNDAPKEIKRKVMAAQTDLGPVAGEPMTESMKGIYKLLELCAPKAVYEDYLGRYERAEQRFYGDLKKELAKNILELVEPIQQRYQSPDCSVERVKALLAESAAKVRPIAKTNLRNMLDDMNFKHLAQTYN